MPDPPWCTAARQRGSTASKSTLFTRCRWSGSPAPSAPKSLQSAQISPRRPRSRVRSEMVRNMARGSATGVEPKPKKTGALPASSQASRDSGTVSPSRARRSADSACHPTISCRWSHSAGLDATSPLNIATDGISSTRGARRYRSMPSTSHISSMFGLFSYQKARSSRRQLAQFSRRSRRSRTGERKLA
ncbi:hypothetical protein [Lentzea sp. HUAS12]|uniref:hypothetical protein n=1 Tax=Lentzea sp. HUAS12 TaxID=2951806 RepID=UPI0020A131AD|nr:hypothetical protein [Lentzea sp. HUAS12]USX53830.1 hypothetical protein ND450_06905 [Lentzea sp. HUAS12]